MTTSVRCSQCGAPFRAAEERFCTYCGTQRPTPAPPPPTAAPDHSARFAAARAHASLRELMGRAPSTAGHTLGGLFTMGCLVLFCVVAGTLVLGFNHAGAGLFAVVPCFIFGVGLFLLVTFGARMARFHGSELERKLVRVLDERTDHSGGENSTTTYYVTLEGEDRRRSELRLEGSLAGKLTRDDIGLAYVKGDVLLDFARLEV
jgi:hypothetical protein